MTFKKSISFFILLLWGLLYSNSLLATTSKVWKIQKLYMSNGDVLSGYVKRQIIGEETITFCTQEGERTIYVDSIQKILSDVESGENINRTKREYTLKDGSKILGRYVGEIPGQELYVKTEKGIDTIRREDIQEWELKYSHLDLKIPMLDLIVEKRDENIPGSVKKGIIVFQSYNQENNLIRIMLTDGGFETISIMDIERMEKVENDYYQDTPLEQFFLNVDSCRVNGKEFEFVKYKYSQKFVKEMAKNAKLKSKVFELARKYKVECGYDGKIEIVIYGDEIKYDSLVVYPLVVKNSKRKDIGIEETSIPYVISYDEYTCISKLTFYVNAKLSQKENASKGNAFILLDFKKDRYMPIQCIITK